MTSIADFGLGRRHHEDLRDLNHLMRDKLPLAGPAEPAPPVRTTPWRVQPCRDQAKTSTCFPPGTLIRLSNGSHKPIEDLRPLDKVVTAEGGDGLVTQVMARYTDSGLVKLVLWGHSHLKMTPEHPVLTKRGYVPASELKPKDMVAVTKHKISNAESFIDTNTFVSGVKRTRAGEVRINSSLHGPILTTITAVPEKLEMTYSLGRLMGLYLAEGSSGLHQVIWTFGSHEEETLVKETVSLIRECLGASARIQHRPNNSINVILGGVAWAALFKGLFGHGSSQKGLSDQITAAPEPFLSGLFDGWMDGDGCSSHRRNTGVTVSHKLAMDMFCIAQDLNKNPVIRASKPASNRYAKTRKIRWDVEFIDDSKDSFRREEDSNCTWRAVRGLEFEEYSGYVFNCEVEDSHSYVAEGIGVHNCVAACSRHKIDDEPLIVQENVGPTPEEIYKGAILLDPWPENDNEVNLPFDQLQSGTTVRAAAQWLQNKGYIGEYTWAFDISTIQQVVLTLTPVMLGTSWSNSMFNPTSEGIVTYDGTAVGGHSYLNIWLDVARGLFLCKNSWGSQNWGIVNPFQPEVGKGFFWLPGETLERLMHENGEACASTELPILTSNPTPGAPAVVEPPETPIATVTSSVGIPTVISIP